VRGAAACDERARSAPRGSCGLSSAGCRAARARATTWASRSMRYWQALACSRYLPPLRALTSATLSSPAGRLLRECTLFSSSNSVRVASHRDTQSNHAPQRTTGRFSCLSPVLTHTLCFDAAETTGRVNWSLACSRPQLRALSTAAAPYQGRNIRTPRLPEDGACTANEGRAKQGPLALPFSIDDRSVDPVRKLVYSVCTVGCCVAVFDCAVLSR
jgi:hypothetical protein